MSWDQKEEQAQHSVAVQMPDGRFQAGELPERENFGIQNAPDNQQPFADDEHRFGAAFKEAPVAMAIALVGGKFQEVNARFSAMLRYSPEKLMDKSFFDVTHLEDLVRARENLSRLVAGQVDEYVQEQRYRRSDDTVVCTMTAVTLL